jgi:hypothetical protein
VHDWCFKTGLAPGGGLSRVDRYIPQRGEPNISLKRRGDKPDFEVKGSSRLEEALSLSRSRRI